MSTKKTMESAETVEVSNTADDKKTEDKSKGKVKIYLPSDPLSQGSEQEFFSVNGDNIIVQTDTYVEVDEKFAEVINNRAKARQKARDFIKSTAYSG